jgi:hypothetical protein
MRGTGEVADTSSSSRQPSNAEASVAGMSEEQINSRTPADIPDLVSEDIVGAQLKEAAQAEEDPELRERLWEEYRAYHDL